jgi:hypothetical protein
VRRDDLEEAITSLSALIEANAPEAEFQHFFEKHDVVMEVLGFSTWIAQPRLPIDERHAYVPDFLAQTPEGVWHVVDLKTPAERILLGRDRRETFTATMNSYVAQLDEYREYFADSARRDQFLADRGREIHADPDMMIIAGSDSTVDSVEVHRHCRRLGARLDVVTFDAVLSALERDHAHHYGGLENLEGLSFYYRIRLHEMQGAEVRYLTETWDADGNGWRVVIKDGQPSVQLYGPAVGSAVVSAGSLSELQTGEWIVLSCEVGSSADAVVLQLRVDNRLVAYQQLVGNNKLSEFSADYGVLGADRDSSQGAAFDLAEQLAYARLLGFRDRNALMAYLFARNDLLRDSDPSQRWIAFARGHWMGFDSSSGSRDLRQGDPAFAPRIQPEEPPSG